VRVLVVDDDTDTVELLALSLTLCHRWDVRTVTMGLQALEICRTEALDAVLLDVEMPVMDGREVLAALRADPRTAHLPVIFVTALADPVLDRQLYQLGATAVLPKPLEPLHVGEQVACHLGWSPLPPGPVDIRTGGRQRDHEGAATSGRGLRRDPSTVCLDDPAGDGEAESGTPGPVLTGDVELDEGLEDLVELPLGDTGPVVAHLKLRTGTVHPAPYGDCFPLR
jgi:CheY-like chemotaxis protein